MAPPSLKAWRPPKLGLRVALTPLSFRKMIWQDGSRVLWEKSKQCPCSVVAKLEDSDEPTYTGEALEGCECKGTGLLYHDAQEISATVVGASKNPLFYQLYGEHAKGMASITCHPEHMLKSFDRLTVLESIMPMHDLAERLEGDRLRLRYPIASTTFELGSDANETILSEQESNGTHIRVAGTDGKLISGTLVEGTDYSVTDEGEILWIGDGPAVGARLSCDYFCHPVYVVNDTPHVHRDTNVIPKHAAGRPWRRLPTQVHAWLEHMGPPHGYQTSAG